MTEATDTNTIAKEQGSHLIPVLKFLYQIWWRVETESSCSLPETGPALIVGNTSGYIPWPALMFIYSLLIDKTRNRTVYTLIDNDLIEDEKVYSYLYDLNFSPWSYDNAKQLIEKGELIMVFPEDNNVIGKTFSMRNRIKRFDWTKFLPAIESNIPIYPLATLGIDEANMVLYNSDFFSQLFKVKAFPVTPFFPWLPFPLNLTTLPVPWKMKLLPALVYNHPKDRQDTQEQAKKVASRAEGEIQAEINRLLRKRTLF